MIWALGTVTGIAATRSRAISGAGYALQGFAPMGPGRSPVLRAMPDGKAA